MRALPWLVVASLLTTPLFAQIGPDVIVGALTGPSSYGTDGSGIFAYSIGTTSCNVGDEELLWISNTNEHPVIGQSIYRYYDGRLEHLGQGWLKHGFFALQGGLCGSCTPSQTGGSALGVGCSDPYTSGRNGSQGGLGPKSEVNASTGIFSYPPSNPPYAPTIGRRVQVHGSDLGLPGAQYFGEAQYVTPDDAAAGNGWNNSSWRELTIGASPPHNASLTGPTHQQEAAIFAWQSVDPLVTLLSQDVDGRIYLASRVTDNGDGTWRYEYAIQNVSSDRSIGAFSLPVDSSVSLSGIGFHDVDYHSNEPYDGTDWPGTHNGTFLTWETAPHSTNANANAIRWGTLYNFYFTADVPPEPGTVTLGMFKPGTPSSITFTTDVPGPGSGIAGPTNLNCTEFNSDVTLGWTNTVSYDSIEVSREGIVIATLAGSASSYVDVGAPVGPTSYLVRGYVGGTPSGAASCAVDVIGLPFPENLTCSDIGGGSVQLDWTNPFGYDGVNVRRDGVVIATLAGNATTYIDSGLANGSYHYDVSGVDAGTESQLVGCDVVVLSGALTGVVLVFDPADANGGGAVNDTLVALGQTTVVVSSILSETLAEYDAVFVCLGIFPNNHVLSSPEGDQLAEYILAGGRVYCEGGDTWAYDTGNAFHAVSGVNGLSDGSADLSNLTGLDSGQGLDLTSIGTVGYSGENNWIDHLAPTAPEAGVVWTNAGNSDDIGIFFLPSTQGPVIGCSFQFEGIGNASDREATMAFYLDAIGLGQPQVPAVTGLTCSESGGDVNLSWSNATGYDEVRVYRDGGWIMTLPGAPTTFTDVAPGGGSYLYDVRGVVGSDESDGVLCAVNVTPSAPSGLGCSASGSAVNLSWSNGEPYDTIEVRRNGALIATVGGAATSAFDPSAGGGSHVYTVRGVNDGVPSGDASCAVDVAPLAPTGLSCSVDADDVTLVWTNAEAYDSITVLRDGAVIATLAGGAAGTTDVGVVVGPHTYEVFGTIDGVDGTGATCGVTVENGFVRGEINGDGGVNLADVIALGAFLFGSGPSLDCEDAADVNDDGSLGVDDMIAQLSYIFSGGAAPPAPFGSCGADPTGDALGCARFCP